MTDRANLHTSNNNNPSTPVAFEELFDIVRKLRSPEGCPWDREQTLETLRDALIEESYECVDAVNESDTAHIREELGDVFLVATMMSYIEEENGNFTVSDVLLEISEKLVRRHPHVFADSNVTTSSEVIEQWNAIKATEKSAHEDSSAESAVAKPGILDKIPGAFPPLRAAWEYQKKAAKKGFDWPDKGQIFGKLDEEVTELKDALHHRDQSHIEEEIGDILFTVVNLARANGITPDLALQRTNAKFKRRFGAVERAMNASGTTMNAENLHIMNGLWEQSKESVES